MSRTVDLRLGFVTARSMTKEQGGWLTDAGVGRVIDELARRCPSLTVAMSAAPSRVGLADHQLEAQSVLPLPYLPGVVGGLRLGRACRPVVAEVEQRSDVTIVQLPFAAPTGLWPIRGPRVYHACADIAEVVRQSASYRGLKAPPARTLATVIDEYQRWLVRRSNARLVANGDELLRHLGPQKGSALVSASLWAKELESVPRQSNPETFRVLFVGYLRREKGIDYLLDACAQLASRLNRGLELAVVGPFEQDARGLDTELAGKLQALRQRAHVEFVGPKPFGPELFAQLAQADVLALPSLSEGTPRVLVEARAFGCPVVATRVGGIPSSVEHDVDGLLVPPRDAGALVAALERVATDAALAARLSAQGLARARRHTVEAMVDSMLEQVVLAARR